MNFIVKSEYNWKALVVVFCVITLASLLCKYMEWELQFDIALWSFG